MSKKIVIAEPHGFCFGINRAINLAKDTAKKYKKNIYFLGELVHNQHVVGWLEKELGIKTVKKIDQIPDGSIVIIRAHGATPNVYEEIKKRNLEFVDATCPLVVNSHLIVKKLAEKKNKIIFVCNDTRHDETVGVVGEAPDFVLPAIMENIENLVINDPKNTVVMTQTTLSILETEKAMNFLKDKYPELTVIPHICQATTERQKAIIDLAKKIGFVVIVGSPTSANSNSLRQTAELAGAKTFIVDNADELKKEWFDSVETVVVSSGASTPEEILGEVVNKINSF